ncbi:armadillo-type protein [Lasiosphaeria ovina]|uniref:Armadillo-type protein n=1 Tax=Lasiosphaeria ovina TaxID=92902 RepID=A0AAE0NMS4_9PEZI|nr:armadillo-type protein [Lasiosphaeria ovina]
MPSVAAGFNSGAAPSAAPHHQRTKSSVLRSIMGGGHRRNNSDGAGLPASSLAAASTPMLSSAHVTVMPGGQGLAPRIDFNGGAMGYHHNAPLPQALIELRQQPQPQAQQQYQQERSPERHRHRDQRQQDRQQQQAAAASPTKTGFATISIKAFAPAAKEPSSPTKASKSSTSSSPTKPKKAKSSTNLAALLSRPKSIKNLKQLLLDQDSSSAAAAAAVDRAADRAAKDKENRTPPNSLGGSDHVSTPIMSAAPPPIYAQFASQQQTRPGDDPFSTANRGLGGGGGGGGGGGSTERSGAGGVGGGGEESFQKLRPKSFQPYATRPVEDSNSRSRVAAGESRNSQDDTSARRGQTWGKADGDKGATTRSGLKQAFSGFGGGGARGAKPSTTSLAATPSAAAAAEPVLFDPKDIDEHLEAMLDRRNIPENQRYKMRNLNKTIKMEFVRQDWAETQQQQRQQQAQNPERPGTNGSEASAATEGGGGAAAAAATSTAAGKGSDHDDNGSNGKKKKHTRGRSLTLVRGGGGSSSSKNKSASSSPTKKLKTDSSLGRHFRTKSTESIASEHGASSSGEMTPNGGSSSSGSSSSGGGGGGGFGSGILAKVKGQQGPGDFVQYLRKVQQPELVEVGKLHKLRLLLRNETVAWTDEFIRQGGMKEIVELLHRIMAVEWREEHEDALLHETLLCLKALCTTALALQYLHSIQATLFPALLHMIFDPEKKGPSEFTTRSIITSVLLTYIECAPPEERTSRAQTVLRYLRDPEAKEDERPLDFVLEMRRERPYRVWCKEVVSVTKEVFWIFLHNLNIVALPKQSQSSSASSPASDKPPPHAHPTSTQDKTPAASSTRVPGGEPPTTTSTHGPAPQTTTTTTTRTADPAAGNSRSNTGGGCGKQLDSRLLAYMARHFPQERPPVPAAPYVGGVEWDATNYLASHLDLMNAIVACTGPTVHERNALRAELRISGWERCMGGSLRLCKEKFYGSVHDGLRTWVAAAAEDGWAVHDVRYGPPPESRSTSPVKRAAGGGGGKKKMEDVPKLEMPKLDFGLGNGYTQESNDAWLS